LFYVPFTRRTILGFIRDFRKILKEGRYHAIHDHQDYIAGLHFFAGAGRLPFVRIAHVHNPLYHRTTEATAVVRSFLNSIGKRLVLGMGTHVLGTSRQIVREYGFRESSSKDLRMDALHCGFDVTRYIGDRDQIHSEVCDEFGWTNKAKIVLFVGRLDGAPLLQGNRVMTHKNAALALDIGRACISIDENIRLVMVGAGDAKRREFEEKIKIWGLAQKICFTGLRADVQRLMLGSNLLLFPSLAEGLGMVVVEAQAAGLRVLASDTTPAESVVIPELVKFLSLDLSPRAWADEAIRAIGKQPPDAGVCNSAVEDSPYSIRNSATALLRVLDGGRQHIEDVRAPQDAHSY